MVFTRAYPCCVLRWKFHYIHGGYHSVEIGPWSMVWVWSLSYLERAWNCCPHVIFIYFETCWPQGQVVHRQPERIVCTVEAGSGKQHLQSIVLNIFEMHPKHGIRLNIDWIPHSLNDKADYVSSIQDFDTWKVNPQLFSGIDLLLDPHTVDCV